MDANEKRLDDYQKEMARLNKRFYQMKEQETQTHETHGRAAYLQLKKQNEEEYRQSEEAIRNKYKDLQGSAGSGESIQQKAGQATKRVGQGVQDVSKGIETAGKITEGVGKVEEIGGKGIQKVGQGVEQAAKATEPMARETGGAIGGAVGAGGGAIVGGIAGAVAGEGIGAIPGALEGAGQGFKGGQEVGRTVGTAASKAAQAAGQGAQEFGKGVEEHGKLVKQAGQNVKQVGQQGKQLGGELKNLGEGLTGEGTPLSQFAALARGEGGKPIDVMEGLGKAAELFGGKEGGQGGLPGMGAMPGGGGGQEMLARSLKEAQRQAQETMKMGMETAEKLKQGDVGGAIKGAVSAVTEMAGQLATGKILQFMWENIYWVLPLLYIDFHFIMRYIASQRSFCAFGAEWTQGSGGMQGISGTAGQAAKTPGHMLEIAEIIAMALCNAIVAFVLLCIWLLIYALATPCNTAQLFFGQMGLIGNIVGRIFDLINHCG